MLSCEICKIFKTPLSTEHLRWLLLGELKTLSNIWDWSFPQFVTGYRDEYRIFPNIYDGAFVSLWIVINLKNAMKVFAYYGKDECFYKYFRILYFTT